ncbi:phosphoethanolamine transferase [Enterobacter kobei]|uniref:phosphoethanolamine transferase n=1 Tax=Enterobacter kobei TaxID=208224 RepID=UPI000B3C797F|nr:phosphoethanolamine transferase [Enterobacter kobei]MBT1799944.1 phosphoethanolamine transferase [Enterobacter kobei]MBW7697818.1 phosphoethanolamine transferase [Enterobacter kobei]MBW7774072.1 phosphoethanolamine transferase [Enterobacter kobei]MCK6865106.1 phosphoethanolamine transferase [Enterobacter kobei]MCO7421327.1 phosphoethanolamine transferase [Enterobacter kobei]
MSTHFSLRLVDTASRFTSFLNLAISLFIFIAVNILHARYNLVINRALVFLLMLLMLKCISNKFIRNMLAIVLLIPVAADISLQLFAWRNFDSAFSYGFAMSIIHSAPDEAISMLNLYWRECIIFITLSAFFIYTANTGTWPVAPRFRRWPAIALSVTLLAFYGQALQHQLRKSSVESLAQRVVQATPVSTAKVFMQAIEDNAVIANIGNNIPDYKLTLTDTGIDNYVLVIGESERAVNMGIYGYQRDTTPELEKQKSQLLLFRNAVAPAPVTIMAVPLAMTADKVNIRDPRKYSDNVINIANKAGYETYWFSRQGKGGAHNNVITGIAMNSKQHEWIDGGYDEDLLPLLQNALKAPGKKVIVLHLYGSHEPSCVRFPANQAVLHGGSEADDCYDNSVRYTDTVMGKMFSMLDNSRSSVMYFSDHGLIRNPQRAVVYSHGNVNPPREALHIPVFIWYGHQVKKDKQYTGEYNTTWSADDVNTLAELWLGIHRQEQPFQSLPSWLDGYDKNVSVLDTTGKTYYWSNIH